MIFVNSNTVNEDDINPNNYFVIELELAVSDK